MAFKALYHTITSFNNSGKKGKKPYNGNNVRKGENAGKNIFYFTYNIFYPTKLQILALKPLQTITWKCFQKSARDSCTGMWQGV